MAPPSAAVKAGRASAREKRMIAATALDCAWYLKLKWIDVNECISRGNRVPVPRSIGKSGRGLTPDEWLTQKLLPYRKVSFVTGRRKSGEHGPTFTLRYVMWAKEDIVDGIDIEGGVAPPWPRFEERIAVWEQRGGGYKRGSKTRTSTASYDTRRAWPNTAVLFPDGTRQTTGEWWEQVQEDSRGASGAKAQKEALRLVNAVWAIVVDKEPCPCFAKRVQRQRLRKTRAKQP